jgi:hypothetical protein
MFHFKWYYTCSENYAFSKGKKGTQLTKNTTNIYIFIKINVTLKRSTSLSPRTSLIPHNTQASMAGAWVVGRGSAAGGAGADNVRGLT